MVMLFLWKLMINLGINQLLVFCKSAVSSKRGTCVSSFGSNDGSLWEKMLSPHWLFSENGNSTGTTKDISHQVTGCHKVKFTQFALYKCHNVPVQLLVLYLHWEMMAWNCKQSVTWIRLCVMHTLFPFAF